LLHYNQISLLVENKQNSDAQQGSYSSDDARARNLSLKCLPFFSSEQDWVAGKDAMEVHVRLHFA
jgi:hypothetical protein